MSRVFIPSESWGILYDDPTDDSTYRPKASAVVQIKQSDGTTNATHWSAATGGTSSTGTLTTGADGVFPSRWIESGKYHLVINGSGLVEVNSTAGSVESASARKPSTAIIQYVDPDGSDADDGLSWGTAKATLAAAVAVMPAAGGVIELSAESHTTGNLSLAHLDNIKIRGAGVNATTLIFTTTTGNVVDMTDSSFCEFSDMLIRANAQKTAGALFFLHAGVGESCQQNRFRRLRLASCYRAFHLNDCTTTLIEDVQFLDTNTSWTWHSMIHLAGATTGTFLRKIRGGSAATVTNGLLFIDGATVDTVIGDTWDILALSPSTGMKGLNITTGQWIRFNNISVESGTTEDAVTVTGGKGITLTNVHLLGLRGALISGGKSISIIGGEILQCQQGGVRIGGGTFIRVSDLEISDISEAAANTWRCVQVDAGMVDFTITNNTMGNHILGTSTPQFCILLTAGATNRFVITGNRFTNFNVNSISNGATGASQVIANNAPEQVQTVASTGTLTLPGERLVFVSGTAAITSIVAGHAGRMVTLKFTGTAATTGLTDGSNLILAGNLVYTPDDTITLISDGSNWIEMARAVN